METNKEIIMVKTNDIHTSSTGIERGSKRLKKHLSRAAMKEIRLRYLEYHFGEKVAN